MAIRSLELIINVKVGFCKALEVYTKTDFLKFFSIAFPLIKQKLISNNF